MPDPTVTPTESETSPAPSATPELQPTSAITPTSPDEPVTITRPGEPLAPLPAGTELILVDIWMQDALHGWASGGSLQEPMHVLRTEDGGLTWQDVTPPEPVDGDPQYVSVVAHFLDSLQGWVTFQHAPGPQGFVTPVVWRTTDGGASWTASEALDVSGYMGFYGPSRIGFSDPDHGWLMLDLDSAMMHRYIAIYTSQDGGATWNRVVDPQVDAPIQTGDKTGLVMDSTGQGLLTRDLHGLVEGVSVEMTRDGGYTWESVPLDVPGDVGAAQLCAAHSPHMFTPTSWAVGVSCLIFNETAGEDGDIWQEGEAYLFITEDAGGEWSRWDAPGGLLLYLPGDVILSLGRDIHRSDDGGNTWTYLKTVSWDAAFSFISPEIGWAAARAEDERALVGTVDGGRTWQEMEPRIR